MIGHRGAAGLVPENTLPSFERALDLGCRMLELDVYATQSGELVVIHDDHLDRTTNLKGLSQELTAEARSTSDAGGGQPIPLLVDVVELMLTWADNNQTYARELALNIELKGPDTAEPVSRFLADQKPEIEVLVSSFDHAELSKFRHLDTSTEVAPLYHRWRKDWHETAAALSAVAVNLSSRIATQARLQAIAEAGYQSFVYTVNEVSLAEKLCDWGATGVFTDRPDRLVPVFEGASVRRV